MLAMVLALLGVGWVLKSTLGKALVFALGVLMLVFLASMGSFGGLLFGLCMVFVVVAGFGLLRRSHS